ncbi:MAG: SusC/RagA family TonB-linked outer membrane protein, partial [Bacteroidota bacterium]
MTPARDVPDFDADEFEAALGGRSNDNQLVQLIRIVKDRTEFTDNELFGATRLSYEIIDGLTVAANVGGRYAAQTREIFRPSFVLVDPEGLVVSQNNASNLLARYEQRVIQRTRVTGDVSLRYKKTLGKGHNMEVLGLYSRERFARNTVDARASGFTSNEALVISNATNPPITLGDKDFQSIASILGRAQYNYKQKYLFSASIRRDGASVFPEANRYGIFPSVSVGYNIAKEKFFRDLIPQRIVNSFKIRYGYGQTGNSRINSFVFIPTITSNVDYILGEDALEGGTTISDIFNENDLRWETSIQNNLGVDLKLFRSKVNLTVEFYNKRSRDLLFPLNIPGSAGTGFRGNATVIKNIGDIENKGIEVSAGYRGRIGEDFTFNLRGSFTKNVNTVLRMGTPGQVVFGGAFDGRADDVTAIREGFPVGSFFVIPGNGVIQTQDDIERVRPYQSAARYGDLQYQDTNGDGTLDDNDRVYAGNPNPAFEAGLNLRAAYRGFDLTVNLYGVYGNTLFNGAAYHAYVSQRSKNLINMWSFENPESAIPVPTCANNSRAWSDYWLEDGSYLRVRNINFGYTFPKFLRVTNTRVYANLINPFTFTNYTGFDPEVGGSLLFQGVDRTNYPLTRRFLLGLQIGF